MSEDKAGIQIRGLTKAYGDAKAVDGLTLSIERGNSSDFSVQTGRARPPPSTV